MNNVFMRGMIIFASNLNVVIMKTGDVVLISPDLTNFVQWVKGRIIEVENNPFVGIVISAKTEEGIIFFGQQDLFKPVA